MPLKLLLGVRRKGPSEPDGDVGWDCCLASLEGGLDGLPQRVWRDLEGSQDHPDVVVVLQTAVHQSELDYDVKLLGHHRGL